MKLAVLPIPPWDQALTACLIMKNAGDTIQYCKKAFEATEPVRIETPRGTVAHAELRIGTSAVMLAEEFQDMDAKGPYSTDSSPVGLHLYVKDVDATAQNSIQA